MNRTNKSTRQKGTEAEKIAAAYLESKGWLILDQNYFFQRAEVDIVAYDQECIVFVEVRSKTSTNYGYPEDTIGPNKEKNIYKAAEAWMYERKMEGALARFDVITITGGEKQAPDIQHFEDAFR